MGQVKCSGVILFEQQFTTFLFEEDDSAVAQLRRAGKSQLASSSSRRSPS
jgi:hypothetical protein